MFEVEGETGDISSTKQQRWKEEGEGNHKPCYQKGEESSYRYQALWALFPNGHISENDRSILICIS